LKLFLSKLPLFAAAEYLLLHVGALLANDSPVFISVLLSFVGSGGGTERTRTVIDLIDNQAPHLSATVPNIADCQLLMPICPSRVIGSSQSGQSEMIWRKGQESNLQATERAVVFKTTALPVRLPFRKEFQISKFQIQNGIQISNL
jgi:hypothetical protein